MLKILLFVLVSVSAIHEAFAGLPVPEQYIPKIQCITRGTGNDHWEACVHVYPNSGAKVLYYFNGLTGSQLTWKNSTFEKDIIRRWIDSGTPPPIVISISFDTPILHKLIWFMVEKNSSRHSGKFEKVTQEIMPLLQQKFFRNFAVEENILMGVSMGAFNASQLYFKMPGFFSRAALICLPASIVSPFDKPILFDKYVARQKIDKKIAGFSQGVARDYMPTSADWNKNSPLSLAFQYLSPASAPVYIANGTADVFGFDEGDIIFARVAKAKGAPIVSNFYAGRGHCEVDVAPVSDFIRGMAGPQQPRPGEIDIYPEVTPKMMSYFGK